jgi:hypothetical protein
MMKRPGPEDLRLAVENVPVNGEEQDRQDAIVPPAFKTTLVNLVLTNPAAAEALVAGGFSGRFASALSVVANISKADALEEITVELENIRDQVSLSLSRSISISLSLSLPELPSEVGCPQRLQAPCATLALPLASPAS